jgi:hypothetical protein
MFYNYILGKGVFKGRYGYRLHYVAFSFACLMVFLLFSLFFRLPPAFALDDGCHNVAQWDSNRMVADFNSESLTPNLWPTRVFSFNEQINTFYEHDQGIFLEPRTTCASYLCNVPSGQITAAHTLDPAICSCTATPAALCSDRKWMSNDYPLVEQTSQPIGGRMPDYPEPTTPPEWDTKKMYRGITNLSPEAIPAHLISKIHPGLNSNLATVQDCNDISVIGNEATAATVRRYVINNVITVEQQLEVFYGSFNLTTNYGVCGVFSWNWSEGIHKVRTGGGEVITIPVEVVFPVFNEEETPADLNCPSGSFPNSSGGCTTQVPANNSSDCVFPAVFIFGPFGSSVCRDDTQSIAASCSSGILLEDTLTTPPTYTCLGGTFSQPDTPTINISGAQSAPPDPTPGDFDGTIEVDPNGADDPQASITLTINSDGSIPDPTPENGGNTPPPVNTPTPGSGSDPLVNPNTRGVLNTDGIGVGGGFTSVGMTGSCSTLHSDVSVNASDFAGFYPRGWIGNDCKGTTCLMNIARCEFANTKFGAFISSIEAIVGPGSLPQFSISFGGMGAGVINMNQPSYIAVFAVLRSIVVLLCFVVSIRILAS